MKRCPKCNLRFDESLIYCLEDGSQLLEDEQETVIAAFKEVPSSGEHASIVKYCLLFLIALLVGGSTVYVLLRGSPFGSEGTSANEDTKMNVFPTTQESPAPNANSSVTPIPAQSPTVAPIDRKSELNAIVGFIGKYPYQLFKSRPTIKQRLRTLLGSNFAKFDVNLNVQGQFTVEGNVMFSSGCAPHSCGSEEAALAIDLSTGIISCAFVSVPFNPRTLEYGRPKIRSFSEDRTAPAPAIRQKIQEWASLPG